MVIQVVSQKTAEQAAQWRGRAIQLAQEHNLIGASCPCGDQSSVRGTELFSVPSRTRKGLYHTVRFDARQGSISCNCEAGQYSRPCGHVGATLDYLSLRARAIEAARREVARVTREELAARERREANMGGSLLDFNRGW